MGRPSGQVNTRPDSCQRGPTAQPLLELPGAVLAHLGTELLGQLTDQPDARSWFVPACHPRAISSGHERYVADTHGHSEGAVMLATCR
jgi:hypothetical protein